MLLISVGQHACISPGPSKHYSFDFWCTFFFSIFSTSLFTAVCHDGYKCKFQSIHFFSTLLALTFLIVIHADFPTSCISGHRTLCSHIYTSQPSALIQAKGGYFGVIIESSGKKYISTLLMVILQSQNSCLANILTLLMFQNLYKKMLG